MGGAVFQWEVLQWEVLLDTAELGLFHIEPLVYALVPIMGRSSSCISNNVSVVFCASPHLDVLLCAVCIVPILSAVL